MIVRTICITYVIWAIRIISQNIGVIEPDRIYFEITDWWVSYLILTGIGIAGMILNDMDHK